jgi:SpoVK/Ycf46/Vps4 family AAA+-type ATPase
MDEKVSHLSFALLISQTQLARAIAGEAQAAFLTISPSDILSKFVGESEAAVRCIFKRAQEYASQLESKCAVIFFDEIDALGQSRENRGSGEGEGCSRRVLAELLIQLNAIADRSKQGQKHHHHRNHNQDLSSADEEDVPEDRSIDSRAVVDVQDPQVLIVAATNRAEDCDPALLRRFGVRLEIGLPTKKDRTKMLSGHLIKFAHVITDAELNNLAEATDSWSGSDLESLTREAAMAPVRECLRAAALQRRRQRHAQGRQTEGDMSGPEDGGLEGGDQEVRSSLLASFQALRPVTMSDFECAANFWLGNQQQQPSPAHAIGSKVFGSGSKVPRQAHYDSSSDEED